jgi:uncharacterized protein YjbI with pentapeptide repeats
MKSFVLIILPVIAASSVFAALGADLTREQVVDAIRQAEPGHPADFSGKSLESVDLSRLDLSGARFAGADLFGAKLEDANLTGANLSGANLNLAWIIRANFTNADLSKASFQGLIVASGLQTSPAEAPIFVGTDFSGARIIARFNGFNLTGAKFAHAQMAADMKNQSMGLMRTDLSSANLTGADFSGADLGRAVLRFAKLNGASFAGASLFRADFHGADLTGADLTGADATEADFGAAVLDGVKGLETVKGLARQP